MIKKINFSKKPIICLTSYSKFFAEIADEYCDIVLVGDSLGMVYYGDPSTRSVSLNDMIRHARSVRLGVKKAIMVVDMPYGTYKNPILAKKNAFKIIKETKCDAVKLEGGKEINHIIKYLIKNKINVMGHIGLLPQKVRSKKDYKIKGINSAEKNKILNDLKCIQESGVFAIVLEAVKNQTAKEIMKFSRIPIIGIGASKDCDGQILVFEDMLGMFQKVPKFVKKYSNLRGYVKKAVKQYAKDIRNKKFPTKKNIY
tara:strand:- start:6206 stop:6973 length:768 start_codon:yes stop_codon:yes gene_type:complete